MIKAGPDPFHQKIFIKIALIGALFILTSAGSIMFFALGMAKNPAALPVLLACGAGMLAIAFFFITLLIDLWRASLKTKRFGWFFFAFGFGAYIAFSSLQHVIIAGGNAYGPAGYIFKEDRVFWDTGGREAESQKILLEGVSWSEFLPLDGHYGRTSDKVFYQEKVLEGAEAESFSGLSLDGYAKDANTVYYEGKILEGADAGSFSAQRIYGYAQDAKTVFYRGKALPEADAKTFRSLGNGIGSVWAKDKDHVFRGAEVVPNLDAGSFELLGYAWAKDHSQVLTFGTKVEGADPQTFHAFPQNENFAKDKNAVYRYHGALERLDNMDVATFSVSDITVSDKNGVYNSFDLRPMSNSPALFQSSTLARIIDRGRSESAESDSAN